MKNKAKLYKSYGKLIYALVMADDTLQIEDLKEIKKRFANHPWKKKIKQAFKSKNKKQKGISELFDKLIEACEKNGIDREYMFLIAILEDLATKTKGAQGKKGGKNSVKDISQKFKAEVERINKEEASFPSITKILLEGRAVIEWYSMIFIHPFIPKRVEGANHPVLVLPPFLGTDYSNTFIRKYLKKQGFSTYKWKMGVNLVRSYYIEILEKRLDEIFEKHQEKVSLVGWSGGGILAKILANRNPDKVAQLISIGSPVWGLANLKTYLNTVHEILTGKPNEKRNEQFDAELDMIPDVPITCIYTKSDGVVPWKNCLEAENLRSDIKNIEVFGSHSGLGANTTVLLSVANALHQNLKKEVVDVLPKRIERIFYPSFWKKSS